MSGLHHVTAISASIPETMRFYQGLLGLRLVKRTVNFDDPSAYHLYFGDREGSPGTLLTLFLVPGARRAKVGAGQVQETELAIPQGALPFWRERLTRYQVPFEERREAEAPQLALADPDGLRFALVEASGRANKPTHPDVPIEVALYGLRGISLQVRKVDASADFLQQHLGARLLDRSRGMVRLERGGASITVRDASALPSGRSGAGTMHHIAFRTPDEATQRAQLEALRTSGVTVSPVRDRQYFRSIYFLEPGGVLYEIATDAPGMQIDEELSALGSSLKLPPQYEPHRQAIAQALPTLDEEAA